MDITELYTPIHQQFESALPFLGLLVLIGVLVLAIWMRRFTQALTRERAEFHALKAQHELLSESHSAMIFRVSLDGAPLYLSSACRRIFGYEPDPLIGTSPANFVHPDDMLLVLGVYAQLMHGDGRETVTYRARRSDGVWIWVESNLSLVRNVSTGAPVEIVGTLQDLSERLANQQAIHDGEARFVGAMDSSLDAFFILESVRDVEGRIQDFRFVFSNAQSEILLAVTREQLKGQLISEFLSKNREVGYLDRYINVVETGIPIREEFSVADVDIEASWISHQIVRLGDGIAITSSDVTARRNAEDALKLSEERFVAAMENSLEGFCMFKAVHDADGEVSDFIYTFINTSCLKMISRTPEEIIGKPLTCIFPDVKRTGSFAHYKRVYDTGISLNDQVKTSGFRVKPEWVERQVVRLGDGIALTARDITERVNANEQLKQLAHFDSLTGLPNRALFMDRLTQALRRSARSPKGLAVMFVDVDFFKEVNDRYGHSAGDEALREVARRLKSCIRASDTVARLGGDEFTIVLEDSHELADVHRIGQKIVAAMQTEVTFGTLSMKITLSIGAAVVSGGGVAIDTLMSTADAALYEVKKRGRNDFFAITLEPGSFIAESSDSETSDPNNPRPKVINLRAR